MIYPSDSYSYICALSLKQHNTMTLSQINCNVLKVVRDPCHKITLLLLKSKSVRVIVPESCFLKENTYL